MGITKFVAGKRKNPGSLKAAIRYITNPKKTQPNLMYSNTGTVDPDKAIDRMQETKALWGKLTGPQCQHDVISLAPGEGSPELMLDMGINYAKTKYGDSWEYFVAVHTDTDNHLHAHIVANSVAIDTGKKYNSRPETLRKMRSFVDDYCKEHGLYVTQKGYHYDGSVIGDISPVHSSTFSNNAYRQLNKENSHIYASGKIIFEARRYATSMQDFKNRLQNSGIKITSSESAKYLRFEDKAGNRISYHSLKETFRISCERTALEKKFKENASRPGAKAVVYQMRIPVKMHSDRLELLLTRMPIHMRRRLPKEDYATEAVENALLIVSTSIELLLMLFSMLNELIDNQQEFIPELVPVSIRIPATVIDQVRYVEVPLKHIEDMKCSNKGSKKNLHLDKHNKGQNMMVVKMENEIISENSIDEADILDLF